MTTRYEQLVAAMQEADDWGPVVEYAPDRATFDVEFEPSGSATGSGPEVLAWTRNRVYVPLVTSVSEYMVSLPRNPTSSGDQIIGG